MTRAPTPVVIAVAPNGARKTRADHPRIPLLPDDLAQCAEDIATAGASMMHVHVRDAHGRHSLDARDYRAATDAIRARIGDRLVLQLTTEAGGRYTAAAQMAAARALEAEAVSLAIREFFATPQDEVAAQAVIAELRAHGTLIQFIVHSPQDIAHAAELHAVGVLGDDLPNLLFVLGAYAGQRAGRPADLAPTLAVLPAGWPWSACAFGADELRCMAASALFGGHVRVGFENNLALPGGEPAADNAALVRATAAALAPLHMRAASAEEARRFFRHGRA